MKIKKLEIPLRIFNLPSIDNYRLVRQHDGLIKTSESIKWIDFNDDGNYKSSHEDIAVDRSLLMSPFNEFFTWQTTNVKEILEEKEGYIKFKTKNSTYELYENKL